MGRSETQQELPQEDTEHLRAGGEVAKSDAALADRREELSGAPSTCNLAVDIYDQVYHLRGPDPKYLEQLSALVDAKMRAVAQHGTTVDSLRVAVLAALNIADELVRLQQQREALAGNVARNIKSRTEILAEMLDAALEGNRRAG